MSLPKLPDDGKRADVGAHGQPESHQAVPSTAGQHEAVRPKNAYELLEAVAQHIEEEPRRYYQGDWVLRDGRIKSHAGMEPAPCGTACCRAGWIVGLVDGLNAPTMTPEHVSDRAHEILDVKDEEAFWDTADDVAPQISSDLAGLFSASAVWRCGRPGTPEYAKAGADGVREFMREHEAHLKATPVTALGLSPAAREAQADAVGNTVNDGEIQK